MALSGECADILGPAPAAGNYSPLPGAGEERRDAPRFADYRRPRKYPFGRIGTLTVTVGRRMVSTVTAASRLPSRPRRIPPPTVHPHHHRAGQRPAAPRRGPWSRRRRAGPLGDTGPAGARVGPLRRRGLGHPTRRPGQYPTDRHAAGLHASAHRQRPRRRDRHLRCGVRRSATQRHPPRPATPHRGAPRLRPGRR